MKPYRVGVVFVHGIQGNTKQFDHIVKRLPESVLVRKLTLPGHGATTKEFRESRAEQWLDAVEKECVELGEKCEHIVYVGHSMGCLLGLMTMEKFKDCLSGMVLLCCPFHIRFTWRSIRYTVLSVMTKGQSKDKFVKAAWEVNGVSAKHAFSYLFCARPYLELLKLIRRAKRMMFTVTNDTIFCFSKLDEIVSRKSITHAQGKIGARTKLLHGCGHNYFTDVAKKEMGDTVLGLIDRLQ